MDKTELLLRKYDNRVIRGLIQLIPFGIGSAIDVVLVKTLENIQADRTDTFFDELAKGNSIIDDSLLESEDFLHAFFSTTRYALNSRRREKIRMFARLLKSSVDHKELSEIDLYEEYLNILDDLSYREILILNILDNFSTPPRSDEMNDLQWTIQFWSSFEVQIEKELDIPPYQLGDFLGSIRVSQTPFYLDFPRYK